VPCEKIPPNNGKARESVVLTHPSLGQASSSFFIFTTPARFDSTLPDDHDSARDDETNSHILFEEHPATLCPVA
jgi:hypothetical protein